MMRIAVAALAAIVVSAADFENDMTKVRKANTDAYYCIFTQRLISNQS